MTKANLAFGDFMIAGKTSAKAGKPSGIAGQGEQETSGQSETAGDDLGHQERPDDPRLLNSRPVAEGDQRARERAIAQDEVRNSLKNLKRAKQRELKFFVNVALDQATKSRLKRAADENEIKMTTIMKAAIDFYLKENGY